MVHPMVIYVKGQEYKINEIKTRIWLNFLEIYEISKDIVQDTQDNPDWIDFDFIEDTDYEIRLIKVDEQTLVFEIYDENGLENTPYRYRFAVKYDF